MTQPPKHLQANWGGQLGRPGKCTVEDKLYLTFRTPLVKMTCLFPVSLLPPIIYFLICLAYKNS